MSNIKPGDMYVNQTLKANEYKFVVVILSVEHAKYMFEQYDIGGDKRYRPVFVRKNVPSEMIGKLEADQIPDHRRRDSAFTASGILNASNNIALVQYVVFTINESNSELDFSLRKRIIEPTVEIMLNIMPPGFKYVEFGS